MQSGSSCQKLNTTVGASSGHVTMDLESSYMGHNLAITELFVPNNTIKGLFMKTWNIPVSGKVVVPTVVVDVTEDTMMYVCVCCCALS